MLDASNNRINFGEALIPEVGYELDFAVGTSYNLDLESVMFLPVALFFGQDFKVEKSITNELLSALTKVPEKVLLFCQKGKIKAPVYYSEILAFWEKSIVQVHLDKYDRSFHPKIWLIRYVNEQRKKEVKYKFICTSRNHTQSRDWDVAITLDGQIGNKIKKPKNKPLSEFVQYLSQFSPNIPADFLKEIDYINFDFGDFDNILFHPIGTGRPMPLMDKNFSSDQLLIMSPFLHEKTLEEYQKRSPKIFVLSQQAELNKIKRATLKNINEVYQFNPILEEGFVSVESTTNDSENIIDDSADEYDTGQNLHAKLYITEKKESVSWFIGSANCTNPANEKNIEFLTEIRSQNGKLFSPQKVLSQLLKKGEEANAGSLFERYNIENEIQRDVDCELLEYDLRKLIFELSSCKIQGSVRQNAEDSFDLIYEFDNVAISKSGNFQVFFQPLSAGLDKFQELSVNSSKSTYEFKGFEQHRLSPFLLFSIKNTDGLEHKNFVLEIDIDLGADRNKVILKHILGNQEKLFKFLMFLLAKDQIEPILTFEEEENAGLKNTKNATAPSLQQMFPMYEKLLYAASRDPKGLASVVSIVESLYEEKDQCDQDLIPPAFYELISTFKLLDTK